MVTGAGHEPPRAWLKKEVKAAALSVERCRENLAGDGKRTDAWPSILHRDLDQTFLPVGIATVHSPYPATGWAPAEPSGLVRA